MWFTIHTYAVFIPTWLTYVNWIRYILCENIQRRNGPNNAVIEYITIIIGILNIEVGMARVMGGRLTSSSFSIFSKLKGIFAIETSWPNTFLFSCVTKKLCYLSAEYIQWCFCVILSLNICNILSILYQHYPLLAKTKTRTKISGKMRVFPRPLLWQKILHFTSKQS